MSILPKAIFRLNTIPIKIPVIFFCSYRKINPKTHTGLLWWPSGKELPASVGDMSSIPGLGRSHSPAEQLSLCITAAEPAL